MAAKKTYNPERERKIIMTKRDPRFGWQRKRRDHCAARNCGSAPRLVKIKIGVGRGKKKYDKRESIKKREVQRRIRREAISKKLNK